MPRPVRLNVFAAVICSLGVFGGCMKEGWEAAERDALIAGTPSPAIEHWLERLNSLQSDYVQRLYKVYNDPATPLPVKMRTATLLARQGESLPLVWLVQGVNGPESPLSYIAAITAVPCDHALLETLAYSDSAEQQHAAAIIITALAGPDNRELVEHIIDKGKDRNGFAGRLLVALTMNFPWKESLPQIVGVLRSDSPAGLKHAAQIALAHMVLEDKKGLMTLAEFRDYLRARLDELPEE